MPYTVVWFRSAINALARIWASATDQQAVTLAANRIDPLLRISSALCGNDTSGVYQITIHPLPVHYIVLTDDRKVTVVRIDYVV